LLALFTIVGVFVGFSYFISAGYGATWGLPPGAEATLMSVFPGVMIIGISLFGVGKLHGKPIIIGVLAATGIGIAVFLGELATVGLLDPASLGMLTLEQAQILCVILGVLFGVVTYAASDR